MTKVRPFLAHSCTILSSLKIMIIFNITSKQSQLIENDHNFERNEDRATVKMDGLYSLTNALQMQNDFLAIVWWLDCNYQKMTCLLYDILVNFVINY